MSLQNISDWLEENTYQLIGEYADAHPEAMLLDDDLADVPGSSHFQEWAENKYQEYKEYNEED